MSLRDTLKQIENEKQLAEANFVTGAIEKGLEKLGYGIGKFKNIASRVKSGERAKPVAASEKPAATTAGYAPAKPDAAAIAGLNAEQRQLSDFFANPKNHVTKDGKIWGRDPKKVGEFVELDAKTFLPKGQIGVNRANFYAPGALNRELQALERLGPKEVAELEAKAMASTGLTAAEKAEVKSGGIVNWIKKNPGKAKSLGFLALIATVGGLGSLGGEEDVGALPSATPGATAKPTAPAAAAPAAPAVNPLATEIETLIAELEKQPECQKELAALKAEYASLKTSNVKNESVELESILKLAGKV